MGMGGGSAGREARRAREEEEAREQRVKEGTQQVRAEFAKNFNQDYYNTLKDALTKYYTPDIEDQYNTARLQLKETLARNGMLDTWFGDKRLKKAETEKAKALGQVDEMGIDMVEKRKQQVLDSEAAVLAQLTATADTGQATSQAAQRISNLYQRPAFSPLGAVFQDFTAGLATQKDLEEQGTNRYNWGVSNWGNNLQRYMRNIGG